ncbi:glycosyl transferase [Pseudoflavitalea sp. G-6-1-2]|uniref:glycosyltransferase family protein n=1 Tax=Pseudoflavitalea sp. G-6-1-2 TaxID=2728841 RepID=UPI00146CCB11|nr:glycosyltransferase family protein [Pseudoflavitalea sp. G-6-1-2]NML19457.1 glycosyl transferase [Pseudoflavitalea sp. G-6-1-2]
MKILYSIQATGNGHISRAMELLPYLEKFGTVDIFLSGANSTLPLDAPIKYRSEGLSLFYTCKGSLNYRKIMSNVSPFRIMKEVRDLPVEKYDLVLNDFECITSLACAKKKVPSVNFGHQASFMSDKTPRPDKPNKIGEWILQNYAKASQYIGLHFECYDDFIFSPVIKEEILKAEVVNKGHITVYLPSYCDNQLRGYLTPLKDHRFEVFSKEVKEVKTEGHITFIPVGKQAFNESLISCHGIVCGAGFETPAEAIHLKKKMIAIPIKGQYEQLCNAAALKKIGIRTPDKLDDDFTDTFNNWVNDENTPGVNYKYSTEAIVNMLMYRCTNLRYELDVLYPDLIFN